MTVSNCSNGLKPCLMTILMVCSATTPAHVLPYSKMYVRMYTTLVAFSLTVDGSLKVASEDLMSRSHSDRIPADAMSHVLSFLSTADHLKVLMRGPCFDPILADIQRFAVLPSRAAAVDFFCLCNEEDIRAKLDFGAFHRSISSAVNSSGDLIDYSQTRDRVLLISEEFIRLMRFLPVLITDRGVLNIGMNPTDSLFKGVGLLASDLKLQAVSVFDSELTDFRPLSGLSNLTQLTISYCDGITDLTPLSGLINLTRLKLTASRSITNLRPLASLVNLEVLRLSSIPGISDLRPLARLLRLSRISLNECPGITDLTPLFGLPNLSAISVTPCGSTREQIDRLKASGVMVDEQ